MLEWPNVSTWVRGQHLLESRERESGRMREGMEWGERESQCVVRRREGSIVIGSFVL